MSGPQEDAKIQRGMMSQTGPTVNPGGIGDWAQSVGAGKQEEKRPSAAAKKRAPRVRKKKETAGRPVHPPIIIDEGAVNGKPFRCPYPGAAPSFTPKPPPLQSLR